MRLDLAARGDALEQALDAAGDLVPDELTMHAREVLRRARERGGLSAEHTVVALAGATGSGKSSLLNALVGREVAAPGVQRPTTSHPLAVVRGEGAGPLLDWLDVGRRVADEGTLPGRSAAGGSAPDGLVLLDLPDHDSIVTEHRARADHVVERADLLVWVVDPQKYADAALHEHYLRPLAGHGAVTVVVLNQADRLTPDDQRACLADLQRLVVDDGLTGARVLAASAVTGQGVDELARLLAEAVRRRQASVQRWEADERTAAARLVEVLGQAPGGSDLGRAHRRLVDALEQAAGVPTVVGAVRASARRDAQAATGWPPTRWLARLRRDPLRRLGLRLPAVTRTSDEPRPDLVRSSMPAAAPGVLAGARTAVRDFADAAVTGMPATWAREARRRATAADLADDLDQAVARTRLEVGRSPVWWAVVGWLQWVLLTTAVVGLAWLGLMAGVAYLQLPSMGAPRWGEVPVPTALAVGGVVAGLLLALLARLLAAVGARRRAARARRALRSAVEEVARTRVVGPVTEVVASHGTALAAARRAAS